MTGPVEEVELPLDERIALLEQLRADENSIDAPGYCGDLGDAWLERYVADDDLTALTTALDYFREAFLAAPDHEERYRWWYLLGTGHGELARRRDSLPDRERAVEWLTRLVDDLPPDDPDHDEAVIRWMTAGLDRYWHIRYGPESLREQAPVAADRLVTDLSARTVSGLDPVARSIGAMLLGAAYLRRYEFSRRRSDLDQAIALLAGALPHVPPDTEHLDVAATDLVDAYLARYGLDGDPSTLDLAVAAGEAAVATVEGYHSSGELLCIQRADAYQKRWWLREQPADLDAAIDCFRYLLDDDPDGWAAAQCGELLWRRSELTGSRDDVVESVRLLERAVAAGYGDVDPWLPWFELGKAYGQHAELCTAPPSRQAALRCFDRALELPASDEDARFTIHSGRLLVGSDLVVAEGRAAPGWRPPSIARVREFIEEAAGLLDRATGATLPDRAGLAAALATAETRLSEFDFDGMDPERILRWIDLGRQHPDAPPDLLVAFDVVVATVQYAVDMRRPDGTGEQALATAAQALGSPHLDDALRSSLGYLTSFMLQARAMRSGDRRGRWQALAMLRDAATAAAEPDEEVEVMASILAAHEDFAAGRLDEFTAWIRALEEPLARLSARDPTSPTGQLGALLTRSLALVEGRVAGPPPALRGPLAESLGATVLMDVLTILAEYPDSVRRGDLAGIRRHAEALDALDAHSGPGELMWLPVCHGAAYLWLDLARREPTDRAAADRAVLWNRRAVEASGGVDHIYWTQYVLGLAESRRLAGDPDLAGTRELGRQALRGHARQVLGQAGTDYAIQAARVAAADADRVAGWCLRDGAYEELLAVLDAGRGLALGAATVSRGIADQLTASGHPELAAEWAATGGFGRDRRTGAALASLPTAAEIPDDLRDRALRALGPDGTAGFATVHGGDVRHALSAVGADALVYLVPATEECPGTAVVVPRSGDVDALALPNLVAGPGSAIHGWVVASPGTRRRDAEAAGPPVADPLDEILQEAWQACVGPLVAYTRRWRLDRPARLVLVPKGMLGLVPWHAAYTPTATGRRYAVEDAVFSYHVSAQWFCASAARPPRALRSALVVGDPGRDLAFAGIEAAAVFRCFYPDGTLFGTAEGATAPGTAADVLDWLATAPGPSLLHLACHGWVDPRTPADAHLVLAGGETLAARTVLEASRGAALELDQVFLAACTTNVIGEDYDEAFSLATAFLAAGARTVFGSLWPVPDATTSVLMFMVHHFRQIEGCAPVDALHRAQRWMLDPDRKAPPGMPEDLVRASTGSVPAQPVAWAGFAHLGA